jgi:hypothetical protein
MKFRPDLTFATERSDKAISIPASFLGGTGFESRTENQLPGLRFFMVFHGFSWFFLIPSGQYQANTLHYTNTLPSTSF